MIALPVIQYVFSPYGWLLMTSAWFPRFEMDPTLRWSLVLLAGCIVACVLSLVAVRVLGAPVRIWYVGLAATTLRVLALVQLAIMLQGPLALSGLEGRQQVASTFFARTGFHTPGLYAAATVGYLLAMALGCWLGGRMGSPAAGTAELMDAHA